jgi:hypothetical protein
LQKSQITIIEYGSGKMLIRLIKRFNNINQKERKLCKDFRNYSWTKNGKKGGNATIPIKAVEDYLVVRSQGSHIFQTHKVQ